MLNTEWLLSAVAVILVAVGVVYTQLPTSSGEKVKKRKNKKKAVKESIPVIKEVAKERKRDMEKKLPTRTEIPPAPPVGEQEREEEQEEVVKEQTLSNRTSISAEEEWESVPREVIAEEHWQPVVTKKSTFISHYRPYVLIAEEIKNQPASTFNSAPAPSMTSAKGNKKKMALAQLKADEETDRLERLARHRRQAAIEQQAQERARKENKKGKLLSGGMTASVDETGKLIWE